MNEWIFSGHCIFVIFSLLLLLRFRETGLVAFVSGSWIMANIFATKQVFLFGLEAISSDVYTIGAMFGVSLIQELYGKESAKAAIRISALLLCFVSIVSILHLAYIPTPHDTMHAHFVTVFGTAPRLMIASLISFLISQHCEIALYSALATKLKISFTARSCITIIISQLLDTILITILGLYGIAHAITDIIVVSYAIKLVVIAATSPFLFIATRFIKRALY